MQNNEEFLWKDPFPRENATGAVLLSDQIQFLASTIGLVHPFSPSLLRPAAYDLTVGNAYYEDDKRIDVPEHQPFSIPPNGLVYVRTMERFNIPYYLVARYSLRVQQVYRGLLIDNGLHIDPGYCGYIWIPVHNFTTEPRHLVPGQEFISVEFNRTTPLPAIVNTIRSQDELVALGVSGQLLGTNRCAMKVFYKSLESYRSRTKEFTPPMFWSKFPDEKHQSAMLGTEQRLGTLREEIEGDLRAHKESVNSTISRYRNFGIVAVAGLVVGLLSIILPIWYGRIGSLADITAGEIRTLREQVQKQQRTIENLTRPISPPAKEPSAPNEGGRSPSQGPSGRRGAN